MVTTGLASVGGTEQPLGCRRGRRTGRKGTEEALGDTTPLAPLGFPVLETSLGLCTDEPRAHLKSVSISTTNKGTGGKMLITDQNGIQ